MPKIASITCPHCHQITEETMHMTAIELRIRCQACGQLIVTPPAQHCVWCAYADTPCPTVQNTASCNPYIVTEKVNRVQ
ncbi:MAG: GDCCVxC domain-containing (seleno)protein [Roseiflexaceae bacterium]